MVKGKTKTGFEYKVDKNMLNDAEFLESFCAIRKGDNTEIFALIGKMLGKDQKKALYDHVRTEDGQVPLDALTDEVVEIFAALGEDDETKKS